MFRFSFSVCILLILGSLHIKAQNELLSPSDYLPSYQTNFTFHHQVVDYAHYLSEKANTAFVRNYGQTHEGRPLIYMVISDGQNIQNLDSIKLYHQRLLSGSVNDVPPPYNKAIVWLSFGVHGNEAGATESALQTMYELVSAQQEGVSEWLDDVVVILDPCLNPDGFDRYVQFYRSKKGARANEQPFSLEHDEPWPGGRVNHYLFDLNRDWAWQTQVESQQRMRVYQQWYPHVHVDVHEQYPENPYYFAPAAPPYHEVIEDWQIDFQEDFGRNHARYFDAAGWLYFTQEYFDLFYPSYGDTYPIFNGAIGMTHEQAGHGLAGAAFHTQNGQTLRITDRIAHHTTTALSTVQTAAQLKSDLIRMQQRFFTEEKPDEYAAFLYAPGDGFHLTAELSELLAKNGFEFYCGAQMEGEKVERMPISTAQQEGMYSLQAQDIVIPAQQFNSKLLKVLMQLNPALNDTATYDITAWGIPHSFGHFYGLKEFAAGNAKAGPCAPPSVKDEYKEGMSYAYILQPHSLQDYKTLSVLMQKGLKARIAGKAFTLNGKEYPVGTVVFMKADQEQTKEHISALNGAYLEAVTTGWTEEGPDLGSDAFALLRPSKIALVQDDRLDPNAYGFAWFFLDQYLPKGYTAIKAGQVVRDLDKFDILLLTGGTVSWGESDQQKIKDWVAKGGRIILVGRSVQQFQSDENWALKVKAAEETNEDSDYHNHNPGSVVRLDWDPEQPLGYHMASHYYALTVARTAYEPLSKGNVGTLSDEIEVYGFMGNTIRESLKESMKYGVRSHGQGALIYMVDDPLFRGFWKSGEQIMMNAIFFVQ
jgi:murein tripeptide amidase MpaA